MLVLHRIDPSANMARFYALSLENSLFGDILLVRRWGRIGTHGRIRFDWFDTLAEAASELARIAAIKARRGLPTVDPEDLGRSWTRGRFGGRDPRARLGADGRPNRDL